LILGSTEKEEHQQAAARASGRRQGWGSSRPGSWKERVIGPDFWAEKTLAISGLLVVEEHAEQRSRRGGRDALVLLRCRRLAVALSSPSEKLVVVAVVRGQAGVVLGIGPGRVSPAQTHRAKRVRSRKAQTNFRPCRASPNRKNSGSV
jgi:hypothetical protein